MSVKKLKKIFFYAVLLALLVVPLSSNSSNFTFIEKNDNISISRTLKNFQVVATETATETPTSIPSMSPTPIETVNAEPTPTLRIPESFDEQYYFEPLLTYNVWESIYENKPEITEHPITGELYFATMEWNDSGNYFFRIYTIELPQSLRDISEVNKQLVFEHEVPRTFDIYNFDIKEDGTFVVNHSNHGIRIISPDGNYQSFGYEQSFPLDMYVVKTGDKIPNTKPGDIIVLRDGYHLNYSGSIIEKIVYENGEYSASLLIEPFESLNNILIRDMTIGPGGYLYLLLYGAPMQTLPNPASEGPKKIMFLDDNAELKEYSHLAFENNMSNFVYSFQDGNFYISTWTFPSFREQIYQYNGHDNKLTHLTNAHWNTQQLLATQHHPALYCLSFVKPKNIHFSKLINKTPTTPTPTPSEPTPTPTPIPGWFVLDGFGGIHSTTANVNRPILPYWNFSIARDIEPDPLGRGWYMLDGLGGIHASSPDMPRPTNLPYFGFDIARNLEVKVVDGEIYFYLLDGFGGIHSTDPNFLPNLPIWFNQDWARDLEPVHETDEWMVMDVFGTVFIGPQPNFDIPRMVEPNYISPIMRGMVRFPDHTTTMIDIFGGRHTNPFHPAKNVVDGLPDGFYFYGWDIIWDVELIPEEFIE